MEETMCPAESVNGPLGGAQKEEEEEEESEETEALSHYEEGPVFQGPQHWEGLSMKVLVGVQSGRDGR